MARWLELLDLDELLSRPAVKNPKNHDRQGIRASISKHGLVENPAIDERTGRLVAGHGRLEDLAERRANGQQPPDGVELSDEGRWLVPTQRGWGSHSDSAADSYIVGSNYLVISGGMDNELMAQMMLDYQSDDQWLIGTGYGQDEVDKLLGKGEQEMEPVEFLARRGEPEPDERIELVFSVRAGDKPTIVAALDRLRSEHGLIDHSAALVMLCREASA